jgi:hypothetical protein
MRHIGQAKVVTARKNYGCDACICITEAGMDQDERFLSDLSFAEKRALVKARKNGWRVMKGEKCVVHTLVSCDHSIIMTWRAIPEIHELNIRHDMYIDAEVC